MTTATGFRNRIVGAADVPPAELVPNDRNWRLHPKAQVRALEGALGEVGWVQQILVNRTTGRLVDGHARLALALERSETTVPVLYVELEPDEEALVLASLDPIGAMAGKDQAALDALLADVSVDDAGLRALLGDLGKPFTQGLVEPDDAPDRPADPWVQSGDLFELGDHRLLVGDATSPADVARAVGDGAVDLLWTDPPYGVDYVGGTAQALTIANDALGEEGTHDLVRAALELAPLRPGGVFYVAAPSGPLGVQFALAIRAAGLFHAQSLAWVKDRFVLGRSDFHYRHEMVLTGWQPDVDEALESIAYGWKKGAAHAFRGGRKLDSVWEIARPARSAEHPTMKPVELVARAIEYSSVAGDRVYDPFGGSGTTMIAAEQLGRRATLLELDPHYAQVIVERWQAFTGREATRAAA